MDHGLCGISSASATRLSPRDPWLSVLRLLVVWLYRKFYLVTLFLRIKQILCHINQKVNYLILQGIFRY